MTISIFLHDLGKKFPDYITVFVDCNESTARYADQETGEWAINEDLLDQPIDHRFEIIYRNNFAVTVLSGSNPVIRFLNFGFAAQDMTAREVILSLRNMADESHDHHVVTLGKYDIWPKALLISGIQIGISEEYNNTAELSSTMKVTAPSEEDAVQLRIMI